MPFERVDIERISPKERARIRKERLKWRRREVRHGLIPVREDVRGREKDWWGVEYKVPEERLKGRYLRKELEEEPKPEVPVIEEERE